ncbi:MAG: ATP phosphoribosyltransferase regulatory subunit [Gammaproteobacteria bacterium SG8_47]|nr:MAG: ATP phosphoribosyltransferase regulatory subunit [Gammaproteobacteria bacterium SG8_47]
MSEQDRWLLPEGIEEVLPPLAGSLEALRRRLLDMFSTWGYELVIPPFIEYVDSLLTGTGNDLDLQTFKLVDQLSGKLMGIRADMTPQVARVDAHHLRRDVPTRLCYIGTVLHTRPGGFGGTRSPLQVGAELYGHHGVQSDAEILLLMVETLAASGIANAHVDLGHVGIYHALAQQAQLSASQEQALFEALQRKATPELAACVEQWRLPMASREMLLALVELNGGDEVLEEARLRLAGGGAAVLDAIDYLAALADAARAWLPGATFHYDLAELRGYHYHTGVVFAAFVPGHGQAIAQGGRYDDIGKVFGRARPATGFSTDLKTLVALSAPPVAQPRGIFVPADAHNNALAKVRELRQQGERVIYGLPNTSEDPKALGCDRLLSWNGERWVVVEV